MAATIQLQNCKLQMRTKAGTLDSGKDKVKSITLSGISDEASAATLLGVSDAIGAVIANPVLNVWRIDENLVSAGE